MTRILRIMTDKGPVTHVFCGYSPEAETAERARMVAAIAKWGRVVSVTVKECP